MNRLEMKSSIAENVPVLSKEMKDDWSKYEKLRQKFVRDYPLERIKNLAIKEYVIGWGKDNQSFCYRIEQGLRKLGSIWGSRADKFGIYHGKTKSDKTIKYRFASHWGESHEQAFDAVKNAIVDLLNNNNNLDKLKENPLSPMFKGKILFLYYPKQFLNIFSGSHLSHFVANLNLMTLSDDNLDLQQALMDYQATFPELKNQSPFLFGELLYKIFGYPPKDKNEQMPLLSVAVAGAIIQSQPALPRQTKPNYEELQRDRKITGDRGEKEVLELEKKRLINAGKPELADKIKHVADTDDYRGFDILSFETDGKERYIEVKATSHDSFDYGFFLSPNERKKSEELPNYYLYLVASARSEHPIISFISQPNFSSQRNFELSTSVYHVKIMDVEGLVQPNSV